jgi:hypothetical protein
VRISVKGFWRLEDVPAVASTLHETLRRARQSNDDFNVVVESFDFPVQANDVADMLTNVMRGGINLTSGRVAVVVGSQLNKLQAERTLAHPRVKVFLSMEEGERWLGQEPRG